MSDGGLAVRSRSRVMTTSHAARWAGTGAPALGLFLTAAALGLLQKTAGPYGLPLMTPSLAASATLLHVDPGAPSARAWNTIVGHSVCAAAGCLCAGLFGTSSLVSGALAIVLGTLAMQLTRSFHVPGAATAALALMAPGGGWLGGFGFVLFPALTGATLLVAVTRLMQRGVVPALGRIWPHVDPETVPRSAHPHEEEE